MSRVNEKDFMTNQERIKANKAKNKRNPQICWIMMPEDEKILDELLRHCRDKYGGRTRVTDVGRALFRLGLKYKDKLEVTL